MEATCGALFGEPSLEGRTVAISGVGKVGRVLAELLRDALSTVIVADVDPLAVAGAVEELGAVAAPVEEIHRVRCDIYAPCALGGALDDRSVPELACAAVVGAANNQLAHPGIAELLRARSIAYVPDYVANAGGIINISHERGGYDKDRAHAHVGSIYDTVAALFSEASRSGETLETVAAKLAEERLGQPTP
jgi:glutamate dehydrogenase/leucine dehydrogenase